MLASALTVLALLPSSSWFLGGGGLLAFYLRRPLRRLTSARLAVRLRRWHVVAAAAVALALSARLRAAVLGLWALVTNLAGLATGRLKVIEIGGQKTLAQA